MSARSRCPSLLDGGRLRAHRGRSGLALVIVLAVVVIATILMVCYFSLTREELTTSGNYAKSITTDLIMDSALVLIQSELGQEIQQGSALNVVDGSRIFTPKNAFVSQPASIATTAEKANLPNLVRRSTRSSFVAANRPAAANYPYTANPFTLLGSGVATSDLSNNGRGLSRERWNKPLLMDAANLSHFTVPDWIMLTRRGPLVLNTTTQGNTLSGENVTLNPGDRSPDNPDFVIGRFAYVIYRSDNGLDVNALGAPSASSGAPSLPAAPLVEAKRRRILPFADPTQLPGGATAAQWKSLVDFRNTLTADTPYNAVNPQDTGTFFGWATIPTHGFLYPATGDQRFMTRQELLKFWSSIGGPDAALPYLTTFTREKNSPSHVPDPARPKVGAVDDTVNPAFPQMLYPVDVTVPADVTLATDLAIKKGDPLVIRRFALDRLKWLTKDGPSALNGGDAGGTPANILRYFGLTWDTASGRKRWVYNHGDPDRIMTLAELQATMATQMREPDFFELLKAALIYGSLGLDMNNNTAQPGVSAESTNIDLQIFRIAANIIDQGDADNFPTALAYRNGQGVPAEYPEVYGIEDMPYLAKFYHIFLRKPAPAPPNQLNAYVLPEVWRPAYVAGAGPIANGPGQFRIRVKPDSFIQVSSQYTTLAAAPYTWANVNPPGAIRIFGEAEANASALEFSVPLAANADNLAQPRILLNSTSATSNPDNQVPNTMYSNAFPGGARSGWNMIYLNSLTLPANTTKVRHQNFSNYSITLELQYRDGGTWRTYAEWKAISDGLSSTDSMDGAPLDTHTFDWRFHYFKLDPRTDRMGSDVLYNAYSWSTDGAGIENRTIGHPAYRSQKSNYTAMSGYGSYNAYKKRPWFANNGPVTWYDTDITHWHRATDFLINKATAGQLNWYRDPDTVVRGGDGYYALNSSGNDTDKIGAPLSDTGNFISRPYMLNRPFQSVAELGYVYRDLPWRSLDFFSSNSADAALLDVFSVGENSPVRAGVVNLNTPLAAVVQSLLSASQGGDSIPLHEIAATGSSPAAGTDRLTSGSTNDEIPTLARNFTAKVAASPLQNKTQIVTKLMEDSAAGSIAAAYASDNSRRIKARRETFVRAIGESTQSRTWNFLIDVVVQAGRYRRGATNLASDFIVEGEKRAWWHVAIDRYTGEIVDQHIEPVYE